MSDWDLTEKRIYKLLRHPYQLDKSVVEDGFCLFGTCRGTL